MLPPRPEIHGNFHVKGEESGYLPVKAWLHDINGLEGPSSE